MNIYVGNLSTDTKEIDLRNEFEQFGSVRNVNIVVNKSNGQSNGYGFVEMPSNNDAENAIDKLNDAEFMGSNLTVTQAKPKINKKRYSATQNGNSGNRSRGRSY